MQTLGVIGLCIHDYLYNGPKHPLEELVGNWYLFENLSDGSPGNIGTHFPAY